MKEMANDLLQVETIWAPSAHFSVKGDNLTARLGLVTEDWALHRGTNSPVAAEKENPESYRDLTTSSS